MVVKQSLQNTKQKIKKENQKRASQPPTVPLGKQITLSDIITLLNITAGFSAILFAINKYEAAAIGALLVAVGFDAMDGMLARKMQSTHLLGKELDSLADFCSFGIAPAIVLYLHFHQSIPGIIFPLVIFVLCGALRLARFNSLPPDKEFGIAITANGVWVAIALDLHAPASIVIPFSLIMAAVMVSRLKIRKSVLQQLGIATVAAWIILHFIGVGW